MDRPRRRLIGLVIATLLLAGGVAARLCDLQLLQSESLRERAERQHKRRVEVHATRGSIVDRHGRELAVSLATHALFAHPWRVEQPERAAQQLAPILDLPQREILTRLRSQKPFVWIDRFLEPDQVEAVRARGIPVGDSEPFGLLPSFKRFYPHGRLGVHVVGFANIDGIGVEGIEQRMDEELRGDPSVYLVWQDGRNGRLREMVRAPETEPHDVVLTLDLVLQRLVEREIERAIDQTGARAATAVLLDPATGQLLALANLPAADPNHFGEAPAAARVNRAVVHQYEPGSTFKIVPLAAALELHRIRPEQRMFCENGVYRSGGRTIRDASPQGMLSTREVLEKSSNICMAKIVERLEPEALATVIERFGFGRTTGIELPGELRGNVRPIEEWSAYTRSSLAFGQEIGVTALQMAAAMAVVANGGVRPQIRVVLGTIDQRARFHAAPGPAQERVISERTARELGAMLEGVIAEGTGRGAQLAGYRLAGKSGTAQKAVEGGYSEQDYVASFVGFGPLLSPRLVALVVLDSPRHGGHQGGQAAAPVFRRIMADALSYLRVPADEEPLSVTRRPAAPASEAQVVRRVKAHPPSAAPEGRDGVVPDLQGLTLREAVVRLASQGFGSQIEGAGTVVAQHPPAGTALAHGAACQLRLEDRSE